MIALINGLLDVMQELAGLAGRFANSRVFPLALAVVVLPLLQVLMFVQPFLGLVALITAGALFAGHAYVNKADRQIAIYAVTFGIGALLTPIAPMAGHVWILLSEVVLLVELLGILAVLFRGAQGWLFVSIATVVSLTLLIELGVLAEASRSLIVIAILAAAGGGLAVMSPRWLPRFGGLTCGLVCVGAIVAAFYPVWRGGYFAFTGYDPGASVAAANFVNRQSKPVFGPIPLEGHDGKQHQYEPPVGKLWQSFRQRGQREERAEQPQQPKVEAASLF